MTWLQPGNETTGLGKRRNFVSNFHLHLPVISNDDHKVALIPHLYPR